MLPDELSEYARNFVLMLGADELFLGRDARATGPIASRVVTSAVLGAGADLVDYGIISTPAIFRESRRRERPAIIVTASHNEPEWNGLKFVVNGRGINQAELDQILRKGARKEVTPSPGRLTGSEGFSYNSELVQMAGEGSAQGVKVVAGPQRRCSDRARPGDPPPARVRGLDNRGHQGHLRPDDRPHQRPPGHAVQDGGEGSRRRRLCI